MKGIVALLLLIISGSSLSYGQTTTVAETSKKNQIEASYPGGFYNYQRLLSKNMDPGIPQKKGAPVGMYTVVVHFDIDKDGKVQGLAAETSHGYGMEEEVLRVLKMMPDWIPATEDGIPVVAHRRQPVTFVVSEK